MADLEDVTLDGRPLQSLRVADLKAALEERGLSKSGQKNALVKRLKGALMLENLQRTSTANTGLQPNSQIGEEMSQNSFIKQYLAKQQELLRQRLEREAREAYDTNEPEDHIEVNNSTSCPPQAQDAPPALAEQHKPPGPSGVDNLFTAVNKEEGSRNQEADMSGPPASGSMAVGVSDSEPRPEKVSAYKAAPADSDDDDSEDGEEDGGDDDDWESGARRRSHREPARAPTTRERSGASCQPPQQHMPSLLSPQLRQPTPPPSPPPELSFPLPDTPKQSPPSPDVAQPRRSSSTSSSGSSSSGSRSSSPEPQRSGHAERKPGPLTLLARKMESEGAFSGAGWHHAGGEGERQDGSSLAASFPGRGPLEGLVSAITHTANTAGHVSFPTIPGINQGIPGAHSAHIQLPGGVCKATATEERDSEIDRERALELESQRKLEEEQAMEEERERAFALEREERQRALEKERMERQQALEKEEREKALQRERELALERERQERELALAREREERERALAQERAREMEIARQKELERQRALEQERQERERREREEMERARELERAKALEKERERALEQERLQRERALEAERKEKERMEREKALEQERLERERLERQRALEQERLEREKAFEQQRVEMERALEKERLEREKALERERLERDKALEIEQLERARALERERLERERALEKERLERENALEQERLERERALEQEKLKQQRLELERKENERIEREKALERERIEKEKALEREREEKERLAREAAQEEERERALQQEKLERERKEKERALEHEKLEKEKAMQKEKEDMETERARMAERERESHLPPSKRGRDIALTPMSTPLPLSVGPGRKSSTKFGEQEDDHASKSQVEADEQSATMSPTPPVPQSSFKKFRFLRDSPIQLQSSSPSMVIKRPRNFSDTPQPRAPPGSSYIDGGKRHEEGLLSSTEQEGPQKVTKQEVVVTGHVGGVLEKVTTLVPVPEKDGAKGSVSEDKEKEYTSKVDESHPTNPLDSAQRRGRDAKKEEEQKQARQRSTSNDSSSSESDSGSSSSGSSGSSSSSQEKTISTTRGRLEGKPDRDTSPQHRMTRHAKAEGLKESPKASPCKRDTSVEKSKPAADGETPTKKTIMGAPTREESQKKMNKEEEEEMDKKRQVKETAMAQPEKLPETNEETPKAFSARKISISSSKMSPGSAEGEQDPGAAAGRKRRWGSSTAVTAKKPSISITTDSLKSLIPDIRPSLGQEAVVDLHPEQAVLSGPEDEEREQSDQDLQIRRTVTQVVHLESQENGQETKKNEDSEEEDPQGDGERTRVHSDKMDASFPGAMETQSPSHTSHDVESNTVTPTDTLIRRSISQQKTGVSITIDDPVRSARKPSPPRGKVSNIVHISNLVRPFTLGQLKELLSRTGTLVEEGFWIDKIKSHCFVTYCSPEEAVATRSSLHGVKWPQSNPKVLRVDFCQKDELDFHKGLADRPAAEDQGPGATRGRPPGLPSLFPERDQWAEREREMERREKGRAEREWDRDKVREFGKPGEEKEGGPPRSHSRERRRKERGKSKEKKTEKKEKPAEDPPAKLLDDLFRKTKATPCIYWLPLTDEEFVQREAARADRMKEREKRRKEQDEEKEKKREEERKERMKAGGVSTGERSEGEKEKDRDRERDRDRGRDRENDKRRDGYRRPEGRGEDGGRRSRSRSDPRERRR